MGFGYIAAGMVFLFNPNIAVFDILPDFIGYLLIYHGLFRMSFSTVKLAAVRDNHLWKLALATALRICSIALLPYTSETFLLLDVFVFGVVETILYIPAVLELFDGFYSLGIRYDAASVYFPHVRKTRRKETVQSEGAEKLKAYTIVFFLIKTVASVLPELTALQLNQDFSSDSRLHIRLAQYKPLFYGFCMVVTLIFGIIWLVRMLRYTGGMRRDAALCRCIDEHYEKNVLSNPALLAALRMKKVRLLFLLSACASFVLILDGVNVLPNVLSAIFLILAFVVMLPYDRLAGAGIAVSAIAGALSVVNLCLQIPYFGEYEAMSARYIHNASVQYRPVRLCGELEYVFVFLMFALAFFVFCRVMKRHAAYIGITGNVPQYSADARRAELVGTVNSSILVAAIAGTLYFILCGAYFTISMYYPEVYVALICLSVVWIALMFRAMASASDNIYERLEQDY